MQSQVTNLQTDRGTKAAPILSSIVQAIGRWHRRRKTIRQLRALPEWQLRDIGIRRDQIGEVVEGLMAKSETAQHGRTHVVPLQRPQQPQAPVEDQHTDMAA